MRYKPASISRENAGGPPANGTAEKIVPLKNRRYRAPAEVAWPAPRSVCSRRYQLRATLHDDHVLVS